MGDKPNALYIMGGGGTPVVSASAFGLADKIYNHYRDKVNTLYAAIGGMRGALYEELTDVFKWAEEKGASEAQSRLNRLKFPASPIFGTSRHKPDLKDCKRLVEVCKAHKIRYVFLNGGNDTMEKAIILEEYAKRLGYELHIIGIPKTVDNDLLITHRCPGYTSFAKKVAIDTMSLQGDLDAFAIPTYCKVKGGIREGAIAQVVSFMGRDQGWGAAASIVGKLDDAHVPHIILTKDGGFDQQKFLNKCQDIWDKYRKLLIVAAEGAFDGTDYLGNRVEITSFRQGVMFGIHSDPHKNKSLTDSRVALYIKMLLEKHLGIDAETYKSFKCREEGPGYTDRSHLEIMSAIDFRDAISVGEKAADLAFNENTPTSGVMVTLTHNIGETSYTTLDKVADPVKGSKDMTKSITTLSTAEVPILSTDGMMINRDLFMEYIGPFLDLNGPNRSELLRPEGFKLPLQGIDWPLEERILGSYTEEIKG